MIKYAEVQALRKKAEDVNYLKGYTDKDAEYIKRMGLGASIGAPAGTLTSSFFIKDEMSPAKKLAILLAGAGVGAASGAGLAAAYHGIYG